MLTFLTGFIIGQIKSGMQKQQDEEPKQEQIKPNEEKSSSLDTFLKTPETKKFLSEWKGKGYTKRGVTKLFMTLWLLHSSDKSMRNAAKDILSSLIGGDALGRVLDALKGMMGPEGIRKLV